ncbi:patatin-like phospholipase family protein [Leptothrix discophora]|uniref:Patatin-like phospholipase family protein n=1 Tax=Leptothrix discophora TaxID=89 RepID=A0ABT9G248_LEPDI|nr:patatin-like phospholipase family protein [Leptothrix discophora]MDP4300476.1 patatin-like phospholipase family protein [Leptothrix discophora]
MNVFRSPVRLSLALQGGGAHGAYTWGVLDALLAERRWAIDAVSGTSAGALNAIVLADGLTRSGGDPDAAREALAAFWLEVGTALPFEWFAGGDPDQPGLAPVARVALQWTQLLSPYQLNPLGLNPLRELLLRCVDFERLRAASPVRLHIAATSARTGALRLFREHELTVDMAMASACLPTLHHAVEIDGEAWWDGGYSANPALAPLVEPAGDGAQADDLLIVMLSPLAYAAPGAHPPTSVAEIRVRAAEIAFNATFRCEAAQIGLACDAARRENWFAARLSGVRQQRLRRLRWHLIDAQDALGHLASETKLLAHRPFLEKLRDLGQARAQVWLEGDAPRVGKTSTVQLASLFA